MMRRQPVAAGRGGEPMKATARAAGILDPIGSVLAVVAHPDDESFGLGGLVDLLGQAGASTSVLCFTHGEASTLHGREGDLDVVRPAEFQRATQVLNVAHSELLHYPDAGLNQVPMTDLVSHVTRLARRVHPTHLLAFDVSGITGHPDHQRATAAALEAAGVLGIPVLIWALPAPVAAALNEEFGTSFAGRPVADLTEIRVSRVRQWDAITCHVSQYEDNPVLLRRLELLGDAEYVLLLPDGG